jgi:hypothetical protein
MMAAAAAVSSAISETVKLIGFLASAVCSPILSD